MLEFTDFLFLHYPKENWSRDDDYVNGDGNINVDADDNGG